MASNAAFNSYDSLTVIPGKPQIGSLSPTAVTTASATLSGNLTGTGGLPTEVWVYLGTNGYTGGAGGTNKAEWLTPIFIGSDQAEGIKTTNVTSLAPDTTYYCLFYGSNSYGDTWADATNFITGAVRVDATDPSGSEAGPDNGLFTIARPAACVDEDLLVAYTLSGSAALGVDYATAPPAGSVTIPAGQATATVTVEVIDDGVFGQGDHTVDLAIVSNLNYAVNSSSNSAQVTITDNDTVQTGPFKMKVQFSGYSNRTDTLADFPALVVLSNAMAGTDFDYRKYPFLTPNGYDIRFWDSSETTELPYEIELWDTNGASFVWVRVPAIPNDGSGYIWAKWAHSGFTNQESYTTNGTTWANGYVAVWHLKQTNDLDSTTNANHGTAGANTTAPAVVGNGQSFPGNTTNLLNFGSKSCWSGLQAFSIEFWCKTVWQGAGPLDGPGFYCWTADHNSLVIKPQGGNYIETYSADGGFADNAWHLFGGTWQSGGAELIYKDGSPNGSGGTLFSGPIDYDPAHNFTIGNLQAVMDEIRVSSVRRSADWIWASYMTMAANASFIDCANPSPTQIPPMNTNGGGATGLVDNVTSWSAWLNGELIENGSMATWVTVYLGTNGATGGAGGTNKTQWMTGYSFAGPQSLGAKTTNVTDLLSSATYYYRYYASNALGEVWADTSNVFITGAVSVQGVDTNAAEEGSDPGVFSISRPAATTEADLIVHYTLSGTAANGADYAPLSGAVTIPAGATNALVTVTPIDDHVWGEGAETVILTLSAINCAVGSPGSAQISIIDNVTVKMRPFKMKIIFSGYNRSETLTNFPALVVFTNGMGGTDFDFQRYPFLTTSGYDLRFWDATETVELPYEIEQWTNAAYSAGYVWVRVPTIATNTDYIWAKWADSRSAAQPAYTTDGSVWANGYRGVWHMTEASVEDSTAYGNTGTAHGSMSTMAGRIGPAQDLVYNQGNPAWVDLGSGASLNVTNQLTVSLWLNHDVWETGDFWQFVYSAAAPTGAHWTVYYNMGVANGPNDYRWYTEGYDLTGLSGPVATGQAGQWHQLVYIRDLAGGNAYLCLDGLQVDTNAITAPLPDDMSIFYLGAKVQTDPFDTRWNWDGKGDEVQVSAAARSPDWLWAAYVNAASNAAFNTCETIESIRLRSGSVLIVR